MEPLIGSRDHHVRMFSKGGLNTEAAS